MLLKKIYIDGFGIYSDFSIEDLKDGFNLFYGLNESGKSTLLEFIRACLFGMSKVKRLYPYQPLSNSKHGGKIELISSNNKNFRVERYFGKKEIIKVYDEKGNELPVEAYDKVIPQRNKLIFENIFAFGLDELRKVESLENEQVKQYIYNTSLGIDSDLLQESEKTLNTKLDSIYKPRGSAQLLPDLRNKIENIEETIIKKKKQLLDYNELQDRYEKLSSQISDLKTNCRSIEKDLRFYNSLKDQYFNVSTYNGLVEDLSTIPNVFEFEQNIIEDYKKKKDRIESIEAELVKMDSRLKLKQENLSKLLYNQTLLDKKLEFQDISGFKKYIEEVDRSLPNRLEDIETEKNKIIEIKKRIGDYWTDERILAFDCSLEAEDYAIKLMEDIQSFDSLIEENRNEITRLKGEQQKINADIEFYKKKMQEFNINSTEELKQKGKLLEELKIIKGKLYQFIQNKAKPESTEKINQTKKVLNNIKLFTVISCLVLIIISIILTGLGFMNLPGLVLLIIASIILSLILFLWLNSHIKTLAENDDTGYSDSQVYESMIKQAVELSIKLSSEKLPEKFDVNILDQYISKHEYRLSEFNKYFGEFEKYNTYLESNIENLDPKEEKLDQLVNHKNAKMNQWSDWLKSRGVTNDCTPKIYLKLHQQIDTIWKSFEELRKLNDRVKKMMDLKEDGLDKLSTFIEEAQLNIQVDPENFVVAIDQINRVIEEHLTIKAEADRDNESINEIREDYSTQKAELDVMKENLNILLQKARVIDEESLYKNAEIIQTKREIKTKLNELERSLGFIAEEFDLNLLDFISKINSLTCEAINSEIAEKREGLKELISQIDELQQELGGVKQKLSELSTTSGLSDLMSKRESLLQNFNDATNEWLVDKMLLTLINTAKAKYENEKQPAVIKEAASVFQDFTNRRYIKIIKPIESDEIKVEDFRSTYKTIDQLSQGTKEQLFLALRLGYIKEYCQKNEDLPLVFDDIFVNFDPDRYKAALNALLEISKSQQLYFFTCHPETIMYLRELGYIQEPIVLKPL